MRSHPGPLPRLAFALLILAPTLACGRAFASLPVEELLRELLDRPGQPRVEGRLAEAGSELKFSVRSGASEQSLALAPGSVVSFQGNEPEPAAIPPLFHVSVGETARLSGMLRGVTDKTVTLSVPWQAAEVQIARSGVQAVIQRPGEARLFADRFDRLDATRWTVEGKPEVLAPSGRMPADQQRGVRLPASGASLQHRLTEPMVSGRLELGFHDPGQVVSGQLWTLELRFRGPSGPATLRVLLGWAEESLAVECLEGPSLAVQRLARSAGWHRLTLRFSPDHTDIAVDGKELAHGRGPMGPLDAVRLQTRSTGSGTAPPGLAGIVGEIQIVRFAEPPASLEIDPTQDEVRLVTGDQLYGTIRKGDAEHVVIDVDDKPATLEWSEVAGLYFRRSAAVSAPVQGPLARVEWRVAQGDPNQPSELDHAEGAVTALSATSITLATPYAGTLTIPRDRLAAVRVLEPGWELVLDASAHHLGDNISTTPPLLDPPLPEGGVLERSFDLGDESPRPSFVVLDVVQVVGETAGSPYSNLVLKGELRTYVALNGKRIDYINHHITNSNEAPERIRIPIPQELLHPGKNIIRIEQTGIATDPTWFDDLGILRVAIQALPQPTDRRPRP